MLVGMTLPFNVVAETTLIILLKFGEGPEGGGGINPISQPQFWPNPSPSSEISGKSQCMENQS